METKTIATEIKMDAASGSFEGYASVFNNVDSYGDVVQPGAYAKTVQERKGKVRVLWNHDSDELPIGRPTDMYEDASGLYIKASFSATSMAQDVRVLMAEGAIDSMSVGYGTVKATYGEVDGEVIRYLQELKLYEFSPVLFPANEMALIRGSKGLSHLERTLKQLDDLIGVGLKSGRPLSAENLTRLQGSYTQLHALLQEHTEPLTHSDAPEAAKNAAEPDPHSETLHALKSFTLTPQTPDEQAVLAELQTAFAFIHQGAH
jgi:uncharacterized protein